MDSAAIKAKADEIGFDLVGIVPAGRFNLPEPYSSFTRSVIVLGVATLDEAFDYNIAIEFDGKRRWSKHVYELLMAKAAWLAMWLQDEGFKARPLHLRGSIDVIDLKKAAVLGGLGILGKNNVVVNKDYGPRIRLIAVFTDADLEPDKEVEDYYCTSCNNCLGTCPTGALMHSGLLRERCIGDFDPSPELEEKIKVMDKHPTPTTWLQCNKCLTSCTVARRKPTSVFYNLGTARQKG
jgi:epoxyqueuosine reductase